MPIWVATHTRSGNQGCSILHFMSIYAPLTLFLQALEIMSLSRELGLSCIKAYKMDATKAVLRTDTEATTASYTNDGGMQRGERAQDAFEAGKGENGQDKSGDGVSQEQVQDGAPEGSSPGAEKVLKRQQRKAAAAAARGHRQQRAQRIASSSGVSGNDRRQAAPASLAEAAAPSGFPPSSFEYILVDAPCSALGLRPRLLQTATVAYLRQCAVYQRRILDAAVQLLKPGGVLVYSTCSFYPGTTVQD